MTPTNFRACLQSIGWSQRALADRLAIHETRSRRWATGRYPIPPTVAAWLEGLARVHDAAGIPYVPRERKPKTPKMAGA